MESSSPIFKIAVLGLPLNSRGQFLLSKRHQPQTPLIHNKWQIVGGGMEFGESPEETLARELQEEIQAPAKILFPHPIVKVKVWQGIELGMDHDEHIAMVTYLVDIGETEPNTDGDDET